MSGASRIAAVAAVALAGALACTSEEHHPSLVVHARSGAMVDLSSTTWEACREDVPTPGFSERVREEHGPEGGIVYTLTRYDGPGCVGDVTSSSSLGTVATATGERSVAFTGVPPAGLVGEVVATKVSVDAGAAGIGHDCYWLDDTVTPRVLYTGDPAATTDAQGYPNTFFAGGETEQPRTTP